MGFGACGQTVITAQPLPERKSTDRALASELAFTGDICAVCGAHIRTVFVILRNGLFWDDLRGSDAISA
jgi:hypothetical protein